MAKYSHSNGRFDRSDRHRSCRFIYPPSNRVVILSDCFAACYFLKKADRRKISNDYPFFRLLLSDFSTWTLLTQETFDFTAAGSDFD